MTMHFNQAPSVNARAARIVDEIVGNAAALRCAVSTGAGGEGIGRVGDGAARRVAQTQRRRNLHGTEAAHANLAEQTARFEAAGHVGSKVDTALTVFAG
jgi:hypothetical protein